MERKKGKKSGGQTEERATGGQPEKESAQKTAVSGGEHAGPHWPQQRKKHLEPAVSSDGGGITGGPSQRPEGEISVTAGPSQPPQGKRRKQKLSQKQLAHVAGKEGGKKKGEAEPMPGVPLHPLSQAPQAILQRKGPPERTPAQHQAVPYGAWWSVPPPPLPPAVQGPRGKPQHLVRPAGPAPGSSVAPGAVGTSGRTPAPSQAPISSPAPATSKGLALQIPKRKGCGTEGRRTMVETNYLSLDLSKLRNSIAYHYDVEFQPALPKRLLKRAMEEFRLKHFPTRYPAFDGRRNLYSSQKLPELSDTVNVNDDESQQIKEFKVTVKYATQINMESLVQYMEAGSSVVPPQNAIQALDVVLRSARMSCGFVQVGRSFFSPPRGRVVDLGGGLEMWYGVFQSAILGWKPFLNIDVAHKGFPRQQDVVKAIHEICGSPRDGNELNFRQKEDFLDFIRDLKVEYVLPNNPSSKRIYRVKNIAEQAPYL